MDEFVNHLLGLPEGYSTGLYHGQRYATTITISADKKRMKLFAEQLGGSGHVSFNLYFPAAGCPALRPCEMPEAKVIDFVLKYTPDR